MSAYRELILLYDTFWTASITLIILFLVITF